MNKLLIICSLIYVLVASAPSQTPTKVNPKEAVTKDGRVVILQSDGTWKYAPPSKNNPKDEIRSARKVISENSATVLRLGTEYVLDGVGITLTNAVYIGKSIRLKKAKSAFLSPVIEQKVRRSPSTLVLWFRIRNLSFSGAVSFLSDFEVLEDANGFRQGSWGGIGTRDNERLLKGTSIIKKKGFRFDLSQKVKPLPRKIAASVHLLYDQRTQAGLDPRKFKTKRFSLEISENVLQKALDNYESRVLIKTGSEQEYQYYLKSKSVSVLRRLFRGKPERPEVLELLGEKYWRLGDQENAIHYFQDALAKGSKSITAHSRLGLYHLGKKECRKATQYASAVRDILSTPEGKQVVDRSTAYLLTQVRNCEKSKKLNQTKTNRTRKSKSGV